MKILVVDDNIALCQTLAVMLDVLGHEAVIVRTAGEAIAAAQADPPRLILLDIGLPDMDGYDACRALRKLPGLATTVFVAQTGRNSADDVEKASQAGFHHFVVKPAPFEQLERIITAIAVA